jgi:hypothetical protein
MDKINRKFKKIAKIKTTCRRRQVVFILAIFLNFLFILSDNTRMTFLPNDVLGSIFESFSSSFDRKYYKGYDKYLERRPITIHDHTVRLVCKHWKNIFDKKEICAFCSIGPRLRIVVCFDADPEPGGWNSKNFFLQNNVL